MTVTITWAELKINPTTPKTSKAHPDWAPQHSAKVSCKDTSGNPQEAWVYFHEGTLSNLRRGDKVMLEFSRDKWRIAKTQTPELLLKLKQRGSVETPAPAAQPSSDSTTKPEPITRTKIEAYISSMANMYAFAYGEAQRALPDDAPPEAIMGATFRLWHSARDKFDL